MKLFKTLLIPTMALALFVTSCKKEETNPGTPPDNPLSEYVLIAESQATTLDYSVRVYAPEALFVGYNHILVQVEDNNSGAIIDNPSVMFMPLMEMNSGMNHGCPSEQPMYNSSLQVMEGTVTFVMPSLGQGEWFLGLKITDDAGTSEELKLSVEIIQKDEPKLFSFISATDPDQRVFVALVEPRQPIIGINNYELAIYERETMMSWPALEMLNVEIDPEMPTMGHGSPNNENPIDMGNGHYLGKVNFTMSGYWKVNMKIKSSTGDMMKDDAFFDITF